MGDGAGERSGASPAGDRLVVPTAQHLRHREPVVLRRARVYCGYSSRSDAKLSSSGEDGLPMTPGARRAVASITHSATSSPPARTKSPSEISPSTRWSEMRWSAPCVAPAEQGEAAAFGELFRKFLVEGPPGWAEQIQRPNRIRRLDGATRDVVGKHHSGATAKRRVVDAAVGVRRADAKVERAHSDDSRGDRPSDQARIEIALDHLGEDRKDIDGQTRRLLAGHSKTPSGAVDDNAAACGLDDETHRHIGSLVDDEQIARRVRLDAGHGPLFVPDGSNTSAPMRS